MKKNWKKTGAALLIAGLTITGTSYALADEKETFSLSEILKDSNNDVVEDSTDTEGLPLEEDIEKEDETEVVKEDQETDETNPEGTEDTEAIEETDEEGKESTDTEESDLPEIPEGYTAGNLAALGKAYEKVQNPTAKAAIKRNMERSIEKWENKQSKSETPEQPETETPEQTEVKVETEVVKEEAPVKQDKPAKVQQQKAPQAQLNAQHREQRQELKANQKAEREALKAERKANKENQK